MTAPRGNMSPVHYTVENGVHADDFRTSQKPYLHVPYVGQTNLPLFTKEHSYQNDRILFQDLGGHLDYGQAY